MPALFKKGELNKKLALAAGAIAVILILVGVYFFLGSSGSGTNSRTYPQNPSSQTTEADYASAQRVSEQRNEYLLGEGDNKTFNGQTVELAKVGLSSAILKIGTETKALGSGKDYSFGNISVRILSTTFSIDAKNRKAILRLGRVSNPDQQNLSRNLGNEFTLAEGETAKEGTIEITVNSISREGISVAISGESKSILVGDWLDSGGYRIRIKDIFYTGEPSESKVVILVGSLGN